MNHKPLPVGIDNFEMLVTRGYYFVDKTMLIKELLDKKGAVNLFIRPRRFGKTLNMSMLQYFFEDARNDQSEKQEHSNPWSVIQFMDDLQDNPNCFPKAYWANTSSNSIVRKLIEMADEDTRTEIEELIEGKTIEKPSHEDITYDEVYKKMDNLWNFMFFTGYFRKVSERMDAEDKRYVELSIPNREVKYIFRNIILGWFDERVKARDRSRLFTAFVNLDVETVEEEISNMLLETISFNDAYESYYHGFLAGILSGMKGYLVKSNREGGTGRSDLFVKPLTRRKPAFVLEFKVADKFSQLDSKADEALQQIDDRGYVRELEDDGYATVYRYGIAFCGKDCVVKLA